MSRYTTNKHGIIIGYSGWFFFRDQYNEHREFPAILWLEDYKLDQINTANYFLQTPAQQFMFKEVKVKWPDHHTPFDSKDGEVSIGIPPITTEHFVPTPFMRRWLDKNTPGWCTRPMKKDRSYTDQQTLFFTRVKHARACRDFVSKMIAGTPATYRKEKE